jgi:nucleotide-binding universal stress UspA family protein
MRSLILVPLDGSEEALAALPVAKVLGKIHQASLCLAHVAEKEPADPALVRRLDRLAQELDTIPVELRTGKPAAQILRLAKEIEPRMIVLCHRTAATPRRTRALSAPDVHRRGSESKEVRAALTAASTSTWVPPAYVPTTMSWPGLRLSNIAPCPSVLLPPMIIDQCGTSILAGVVLICAQIPSVELSLARGSS